MFNILQLFLLIFTTLLHHKSTTNPNPTYSSDYVSYEGVGSTFAVHIGPNISKFLIWISTLYQALYLFLQASSPASIATFFPQISTLINTLPLTPVSMIGYALMMVGGLGRIWCYRTLGKFFTFELTIRNSHKLIKNGPYAYVRHPSYTFAFILTIGMFLIHRRIGNFFPNTYWTDIMFGSGAFLTCCLLLLFFLTKRVINEEKELSKAFGKEWNEYASKTKRFIPTII
ncbi:hypothetical protein I4U23_011147 [Adineta vaga]|nr:hypothetical protein I4U23_011147 [Adineta vaga]